MVHIRTKRPSGKVITRGKPDMREPKGFHSIHMSEPGMSPYQNKNFTKGAEQYTIFDEMKVKMDPWTKRDLGIQSEYSPPGSEFISRASRRRQSLRQPSKIVTENQSRLLGGPKVGEKLEPSIDKGLEFFKGKEPVVKQVKKDGKTVLEVEPRKPGIIERTHEFGLKLRGGKKEPTPSTYQSDKGKPQSMTELPQELPPSEVVIPESPKYKRKPKRSDYLYNKQVVKDIKAFESGKGEFIKGKYKRKKVK